MEMGRKNIHFSSLDMVLQSDKIPTFENRLRPGLSTMFYIICTFECLSEAPALG